MDHLNHCILTHQFTNTNVSIRLVIANTPQGWHVVNDKDGSHCLGGVPRVACLIPSSPFSYPPRRGNVDYSLCSCRPPCFQLQQVINQEELIAKQITYLRVIVLTSHLILLSSWVLCVCNVGDSLCFVYNSSYGVREVTLGSHDSSEMRDMRNAGGALGPVDGRNPQLQNLTCSETFVEAGK